VMRLTCYISLSVDQYNSAGKQPSFLSTLGYLVKLPVQGGVNHIDVISYMKSDIVIILLSITMVIALRRHIVARRKH